MTGDVSFTSDGLTLVGTLHIPATERPPFVVGCHGLFADRRSPKQVALARRCLELGIAYLRIDHRGCGDSQGDFEEVTSLPARCRDLAAAVDWMQCHAGVSGRFALFGSSMGGAVCLATAARLDAAALVTVAAPIRSRHIGQAATGQPPPSMESAFFGPRERAFDLSAQLARVGNILLFHGDADEVVPVAHAREIHKLARPPKRLVIQKNGDHRMSRPDHQREFLRLAGDWLHAALVSG